MPRIALVLIGSVCASVGAAITAKDLCWAPITSGFMAAMIIVLADMILLVSLARHFSWGRKVRFLAVLAVIGAIIFLFRLDTERVFRAAFGQDPPSGVADLTVDSGLQIGSDRAYLMRFNATQAAIDQLAANGRLRPDSECIRGWRDEGGDWAALWRTLFVSFSSQGGRDWQDVPPMSQPRVFRWESATQESVLLLWDAASGRAYAAYWTE
jgi:hypothetical protein